MRGSAVKRDMDLIRQIMLAVEAWPPEGGNRGFAAPGRPREEITYNAYQAIEAGLLDGTTVKHSEGMHCAVARHTPAGHDLLDSIRTQFIWDEVKEVVRSRGLLSAGLDVLKRLADTAVRKHLGDDLGLSSKGA